jgi:hypothetical protein
MDQASTKVKVPSLWSTDDLRLLDLPDSIDPKFDLIAVYAHPDSGKVRIRLDFLDGPPANDFKIRLNLVKGLKPSSLPKAEKWDSQFEFSPDGEGKDLAHPGVVIQNSLLQISIDREMNIMTWSIPQQFIQGTGSLVAQIIVLNDHGQEMDHSEIFPIEPDKQVQIPQARVLMAFWNTLPAQTPAQALRRWNGAHTGPFGQRHGLFNLLKAAETNQVPVVLTDLAEPSSLFALQYMDQLQWIQNLQLKNLLILPIPTSGSAIDTERSLQQNRGQLFAYGLQATNSIYGVDLGNLPANNPFIFTFSSDPHHIVTFNGRYYVPLPTSINASESQWIDRNGIRLELKKAILLNALDKDAGKIMSLGGSLPDSPWADSSISTQVFRYLSSHAWIHVLNAKDLSQIKTISSKTNPANGCEVWICLSISQQVPIDNPSGGEYSKSAWDMAMFAHEQLIHLNTGPLAENAWKAFWKITQPIEMQNQFSLQVQFLPQVFRLIEASRWSQSPAPAQGCVDYGCILASTTQFIWIDPYGGRILIAASRSPTTIFQWISPFSQFSAGLDGWKISQGELGDENNIPGAFFSPGPQEKYSIQFSANEMKLVSGNNSVVAIIQLFPDGFQYQWYGSTKEMDLPIVAGLGDQKQPGTFPEIQLVKEKGVSKIQITDPGLMNVTGLIDGANWDISSYLDSFHQVRSPENPDLQYPPGHFYPFGIANVRIFTNGPFKAEFHIK